MNVAATTASPAQLGRTRITTRAVSRVLRAVAAGALKVDADHIGVELADHEGTLTITVNTPAGLYGSELDHASDVFDDHGGVLRRHPAPAGEGTTVLDAAVAEHAVQAEVTWATPWWPNGTPLGHPTPNRPDKSSEISADDIPKPCHQSPTEPTTSTAQKHHTPLSTHHLCNPGPTGLHRV